MRILIIEDNIKLAISLKNNLQKNDFQVDLANTGISGEEKAFINSYDAILLDLNLPDKDGLEILKYIREIQIQTPIIIISARDEVEQRTIGLNLGADDYITKPFDILELCARIRAVVRRFHGRSHPEIRIGSLVINPLYRSVCYNTKRVVLKTKEFDILEYVANCYPAVVSSEEIIEHIYGEEFDPFSSVLRVHIARLKNNLHDVANKDVIVTIRGKGYYICEK